MEREKRELEKELQLYIWSCLHFTFFLMVKKGVEKVMFHLLPSFTLEKARSSRRTISQGLGIILGHGGRACFVPGVAESWCKAFRVLCGPKKEKQKVSSLLGTEDLEMSSEKHHSVRIATFLAGGKVVHSAEGVTEVRWEHFPLGITLV